MSTRLIAAAIGLAVLVPALIYGGQPAVWVIAGLAMLICVDEYCRMAFPGDLGPSRIWLGLGCLSMFGSAATLGSTALVPVGLVVLLATMIYSTLRPGPELAGAADRLGRTLVGLAWVGGLFCFFPLIRAQADGLAWIFVALAIPWLGDTGGYFAGRAFGRRKLYPRISPKKTWEGFVGGIILAPLGVLAVRWVALPTLPPGHAVALGAGLGALAVVGDLAESMMKRAFDVKDSGRIMPGHGGLLDRVDSVLFVAPSLYLYLISAGS